MIFWIAVAVLSALVAAAIAWPLISGKSDGRDEADFDIEVFRDQLTEIGREQAEGVQCRQFDQFIHCDV